MSILHLLDRLNNKITMLYMVIVGNMDDVSVDVGSVCSGDTALRNGGIHKDGCLPRNYPQRDEYWRQLMKNRAISRSIDKWRP